MSEVTDPTVPPVEPTEPEEGEKYDGGEVPENGEGDGDDETE